MSVAILFTRASDRIDAALVTIEVHIGGGLPALSIVGLPETAVKESRDRVRSAVINSGFEFPQRRITVNLAPADLPKEGGRFDLGIALGVLMASGQVPPARSGEFEFAAELALTGELRPVRGILPVAVAAARDQRALVLCQADARQASLAPGACIYAASSLAQVVAHLTGDAPLQPFVAPATRKRAYSGPDLSEVHGHTLVKRALEVAAAGAHNLLFVGPPGAGKSMLAARLPGILPPMTQQEAVATALLESLSGMNLDGQDFLQRRFRAPHHNASAPALIGGGPRPRPGEISLAHNGVLFLDELPEFDRRCLEALREPLETGQVSIARAGYRVEYPARFQLVAAMNPCPCGHAGTRQNRCRCSPQQIQRYRGRISGPLLDRIDLQIIVGAVPIAEIQTVDPDAETSALVARRVDMARRHQQRRQGFANAQLSGKNLAEFCSLEDGEQTLLAHAMERLGLSARAYHRVLRVARSIADLAGDETLKRTHLQEALGYRRLDLMQAVA